MVSVDELEVRSTASPQYAIRGAEVDYIAYMTCTASKGNIRTRVGLL